jgi:putative ABC transport system substrate-binding protein
MRRRKFIALLGGATIASPFVARAQQSGKVWRIGMLETTSEALNISNMAAFRQSLRVLGYVEHQNYTIDYRSADGLSERLATLATELLKLGADVLVARGTPATLAARKASATVPIVMTSTAQPFAIVNSIARPGGNVTGLSSQISDLTSKRLELLNELLPRLERVALMNDSRNPTLLTTVPEIERAAQVLKIQFKLFDVRNPEDIRLAFSAARSEHIDAIMMGTETTTQANRQLIAELAAEHRLPVIYASKEFVDAGGLISLGVNYQDLYRRAAIYVDKIFKGAKPSDLPIEQPTKFELVINLKSAKALGLDMPPTLLARADEVIE